MKIAIVDVETTGLDPKRNAIWAISALQAHFDTQTCRLYPVRRATHYYHVPVTRAFDLHGYWKFRIESIHKNIVWLSEVGKLRRGRDVRIDSARGTVLFRGKPEEPGRATTFEEDVKFWRKFLAWADLLVAHNTEFEKSFLWSHGLRINRPWFCTMRESTYMCGLRREVWDAFEEDYIYLPKWPRLEEAVRILCKRDGFEYHNCEDDVRAISLLFPEVFRRLKQLATEPLDEPPDKPVGSPTP